jgi:cell division protein FtsB
VSAGDAQVSELLAKSMARSHQLEASVAKLQSSNDRLTRHVGCLSDELRALKEERDGVDAKGGA